MRILESYQYIHNPYLATLAGFGYTLAKSIHQGTLDTASGGVWGYTSTNGAAFYYPLRLRHDNDCTAYSWGRVCETRSGLYGFIRREGSAVGKIHKEESEKYGIEHKNVFFGQ